MRCHARWLPLTPSLPAARSIQGIREAGLVFTPHMGPAESGCRASQKLQCSWSPLKRFSCEARAPLVLRERRSPGGSLIGVAGRALLINGIYSLLSSSS